MKFNNRLFYKKISLVLSVDVLSKIISFLLLPIYLTLMPKAQFGEFTFIYITITTASTLMSLSFYVIIIKDLSKEKNFLISQKKFSTVFIFIIIFNIIIFIFSFFIENYFQIISEFYGIKKFRTEKISLILLLIILNVINLYQYSLIISRKKTYEICFFIFGKVFFSNVISIFILKNFNFSFDTVSIRLFGNFIGEIVFIIFLQLSIRRNYITFFFDKNYFYKNITQVVPLIFSTLISLIMVSADRKILQIHYGSEYLAEYNLVYILLLPMSMIISSFQSIWNPRLFNINNFNLAFNKNLKIIIFLFIFLISISIVVYFLIKILFNFKIINYEYIKILPLYLTMIVGFIFGLLINFIDSLNLYLNKNQYKFYITLITGLIYVILNFYLIPKYAYYGIAISLFISNLIGFIIGLNLIYTKHYINEKT